jgi:hypothetical protein
VPLSESERAELARRADRLSSLLETVGWRELEAEVDRKIIRLRQTATKIALHPEGADQRKLDTVRGTIAALNWFVGVPKNAETTLERFLAEQGIEEDDLDGGSGIS